MTLMNKLLKRVVINNFRSIHKADFELSEINLFSGTNDAGKSNVLKALNLFFNAQTDFLTPLKFNDDFCKIELAKAQKSTKSKQQIKIRVYFNVPKSYKILSRESEVFVEKVFDRNNNATIHFSNENEPKKKAQISKLLNKIKYIYIPALKGQNVLQYLLGLIGETELIEAESIEELNKKVTEKTKDLSELLKASKIPINTSLGLPVFLSDFWEKLSVGTLFDHFDNLEETIQKTAKPSLKPLNPASYSIPLTFRGEGIKSKYVPPLLLWLQSKNTNKIFVWGIDEPENSLEFRAAEELANLYFSDYATKTQAFATSHSIAFINPNPKAIKTQPRLFRCLKDKGGATRILTFEDLFSEENKYNFFDEIGALEIQKHVIAEWREKGIQNQAKIGEYEKHLDALNNKISIISKPLVITEGKTDWKHLKKAFERLRTNRKFRNLDFEFLEYESYEMGDTELVKMCEQFSRVPRANKMIFVFDRDNEKLISEVGDGERFKSWGNDVFSFCIPIPGHRKKYKNISIEFYYSDDEIHTKDRDSGRQLLFSNELDKMVKASVTNNKSNEVKFVKRSKSNRDEEYDKKVYCQDVETIVDSDGKQVAHSKTVFANNIYNNKVDFNNFDISEFEKIMEIIEKIIEK